MTGDFKKSLVVSLGMAGIGIALAVKIWFVMSRIAFAKATSLSFCSLRMKSDFDWMANLYSLANFIASPYMLTILSVLIFAAIISLIWPALNPHFRLHILKTRNGLVKTLLSVVILISASLAISPAPAFLMRAPWKLFPDYLNYICGAILGGLLWFLVGEEGWGGDFTLLKMGRGDGLARVRTVLFGALLGIAVTGIAHYAERCFSKYFILVVEVWQGSGEVCRRGWLLHLYGTIALMALSLGTVGGLIAALSPVRMSWKERGQRAIIPAIFLLIWLGTAQAINAVAVHRYDYDKKSLMEAAALSEEPISKRTVVIFKPKLGVKEWELEVRPLSWVTHSKINVTPENLAKIESYLERHPEQTVHTNAAYQVLAEGYTRLWDAPNSLKWMHEAGDKKGIFMCIAIERIRVRFLRITDENLFYLDGLANPSKYYISARTTLDFARCYFRYGKMKEASLWLNKAKEQGVNKEELSKVKIPTGFILTDGLIKGHLLLNGQPARGIRVGLFGTEGAIWKWAPELVFAIDSDSEGSFSFDHLGAGKYCLALMTEQDVIPPNVSRIKVDNQPGTIEIDRAQPSINIGKISIGVR